jgi:5-methylthioadenosine/S-adenosylhomocysteine deaminase
VHSVWADDDDLDLLARSGAAVITCPQSNAKLASGIAPVSGMRERGITVGIGTDGCASNNSLDLFREMDMLAKLQKLRNNDATAMAAADVLGCATAGGAAALGLDGPGRIMVGQPADLILIDLDHPRLTPFYNQDLLVYAAAGDDVDSVMIGGSLVMQDRKILSFDVDEAAQRVNHMAEAVAMKQYKTQPGAIR